MDAQSALRAITAWLTSQSVQEKLLWGLIFKIKCSLGLPLQQIIVCYLYQTRHIDPSKLQHVWWWNLFAVMLSHRRSIFLFSWPLVFRHCNQSYRVRHLLSANHSKTLLLFFRDAFLELIISLPEGHLKTEILINCPGIKKLVFFTWKIMKETYQSSVIIQLFLQVSVSRD